MLKIFFLKLLIILISIALVVGFFEYNLAKIPTSYNIKKSNIEKEASEIQVLILGSSDAIGGINPAFFSKEAFNMADSSQSLYYDLKIFSKYSSQLKNLRVLIIPVTYLSLQYNFDESLESWRSFFYDRTYGIPQRKKSRWIDVRAHSLFALYGQQRSLFYALKGFKMNLAPDIFENGYQKIDGSNIASLNESGGKLAVDIHESEMDPQYFSENVDYLNQMIRIAKEINATPVIVTPPVSHFYSANIDKNVYMQMVSTIEEISRQQKVKYLNYFYDSHFSIEDFLDPHHVNSMGAEKFTKILDKEIFGK